MQGQIGGITRAGFMLGYSVIDLSWRMGDRAKVIQGEGKAKENCFAACICRDTFPLNPFILPLIKRILCAFNIGQ
jgi:hypothetical protein